MAAFVPISMRDTARQVSIKIKVLHVKRTRARLAAFSILLRLACWICPCSVELETGGGG